MCAVLAINLWAHTVILAGTTDGSYLNALGGSYANAQLTRLAASLVSVILLVKQRDRLWLLLPVLALLDITASIATSHAVARLEDQTILIAATALHHLGATIWIGGLPAFLYALNRLPAGSILQKIGSRFSLLSASSVLAIAASGIVMLIYYVGSSEAMYGTAYGMMLGTKTVLFFTLLCLGVLNSIAVRQLTNGTALPLLRLKRFVEVEIGIGITVLFVAASITSLPPAVDLIEGRATLSDIAERLEPRWPSLSSPDKNTLAFYEEQRQKAANSQNTANPMQVYVPGSGMPLPRNAEDIAWSEYNHHWAGILVLSIGILALFERTGRASWAKHWPLLFIGLAVFLFLRSEAEGWPFGTLSFNESIRDPEFIQHKLFMVLITGFAGFEWSVRTGILTRAWARCVFPLLSAVGGMMLLTHSHTIANVKELLLIEMMHMPIAVFGIWAAWSRWLELRLVGRGRTFCGWLWPAFFCMIGLTLILYREI